MKNGLTVLLMIIILMSASCSRSEESGGHTQPSAVETPEQAHAEGETTAAAHSAGYAKILNGDFSDFAGVWENGRGEIVRLKQDGTLGDRQRSENGRFDEGHYYWYSSPVDE